MSRVRQHLATGAALLTLALGTLAADPAPAPLGRLFMTPEWRTTLERQRQLNQQETRSLEGSTMRLDGVVVRSSGKSTVWVNSQPQTENDSQTGVAANLSPNDPGRATLSAGNEHPADLRVGVTLNRATRETAGGLAAGEIQIRRQPTPQ
jgi:hypothetical protein